MAKRLGGRVKGMVKKVGLPVAAKLVTRAAAVIEAADRALDEGIARSRERAAKLRGTRTPTRQDANAPARRRTEPEQEGAEKPLSRKAANVSKPSRKATRPAKREGLRADEHEPLRTKETRPVSKPQLRRVVRKEAQPAAKQKRASKAQTGEGFHVKRGQKHRHHR